MAVNINQFISAGLDRVYWGVLASDGYLKSTNGTIANGADAGMGLLYANNADMTFPDANRVNIIANDTKLGTFTFQSTDSSAFTLELGANDLAFIAQAQGTKVAAYGDWNVGLMRPGTFTVTNLVLLLISQAQSYASGSVGSAGFHDVLLPNVTLTYQGKSGITSQGEQLYRFSAEADTVDKFPWGEALVDATHGDTKADAFEWFSENRICAHTHVGDGTDDKMILTYTPAEASGNKVQLWTAGVLKAYTTDYTVDVNTKTVTFGVGDIPAAGVVSVCFYEHV
jgi:hypothetical protein